MVLYNCRKEVRTIEILEKAIALISSIISLAASIITYKAIKRGK
nr:MAG TPA: hypothetical protein [Caudoviricetes sp.]